MMSSIKFAELNFYGWWEYFAFNKVNNEVNNWILLENQFMVGLFFNPHVLTNLCNYCGHVNINCSIGVRYFRYISDLKHYGSIWYDSAGIVNILLFTKVKIIPPMLQWCWGIHSLSKIKKWFHLLEGPTGLYYHNTKN